ncbi:MAG: fructosamine kinase family protein, partial [Balneolaceae bacterium]
MLTNAFKEYLERRNSISISSVEPVSGGSINKAAKITANERTFFLKWNDSKPPDMFSAEAYGLEKLREADTPVRIPVVYDLNSNKNDYPGYLLMEYIEQVRGGSESSRNFGRYLAELHGKTAGEFGLDRNNYIGSLPQSNKKHKEWVSFFIEERINPQIKLARDRQKIDERTVKGWELLANQLHDIFPETEPSLLHGDLWGGNYFFDGQGDPVLIDPAVYYGHHEMELSFTKMFGGFSPEFYDAYAFEKKPAPGFNNRVPVYNLYPLLVHVNLFGGHYATEANS